MTESSLAELWQGGRAAWPTVELDADTFIAYLAKRPPESASPAALAQLRTTDLYLACACSMGDPQAIAAFEQRCLRGLDRALAPMRLAADVVAEVKQRVRCRSLVGDGRSPRIAEFTRRRAAWLGSRDRGARRPSAPSRRRPLLAAVPPATSAWP